MFKNFLKVTLRNLFKSKGFSFIKIIGLALGIASCMLILLYVNDEWNYDNFHEKGDEIYRITTFESGGGVERFTANSYHPLAPVLEATLPEKSKVVRYFPQSISVKNPENNEVTQEEQFYFTDSLFFDLFSFEFIAGDKTTVLDAPNSLVLTAAVAQRYFGKENPIGKSIILENKADFIVTGIIHELPSNSTLQFDFIAPMAGTTTVFGQDFFHSHGSWYYPPVYIFAQIPDAAFIADWENYQPKWKEKYLPERLHDRYTFHFQPIREMHFLALENDFASSTRFSFLWILLAIAFLILGSACINYINLSLTRLIKRFPEIGMRKVLGASNRNVLQQMLVEALTFTGLSLLIAIILTLFSLPYFNQLTDKTLTLISRENSIVWMIIVGLIFLITFMIALSPFLGLSKYKTIGILKRKLALKSQRQGAFALKNSLIVFQLIAAIVLTVATLVIQYQLRFLNQSDIGIKTEQVMIVPIRDEEVQNNFESIKNNLLSQSGVKRVSAISNFPWESGFYDFHTKIQGGGIQQEANIPTLLVDIDFLSTMGIQMEEGRSFSKAFGEDKNAAFIINKAAAKKYNIDQLEGKRISMKGVTSDKPKEGNLIGITKNFHLKSLHNPIDPLIITVAPEHYYLDNFVIQLETANLPATLTGLSNNWAKMVSNRPFDYFFLDDAFNNLYQKETRIGVIFKYFTFLALFIALLGLLAISALAAQQRTKEIGIRKVLGASVSSIISLLTKDFIKLAIIAFLVATPIAWYFVNKWLQNFAYRIDIQWWILLLVGVLVMGVTLVTIGLQSFRVALVNPVDSLKSE